MVRTTDADVKHGKIMPHTIAVLFSLLIAAIIAAAGIGIPKGNASPLNNNADRSANESESPETKEESSAPEANPEMDDATSSVTTTTPSEEYFEDPVALGIDGSEVVEKA